MKQPYWDRMERILHTTVRNITPFRRNWCIQTDQICWIAKRMNPLRLRWWFRVDQEMRERGFHEMLPICSDGNEWLLTPFVTGRAGNYSRAEEVKKMVEILARFHRTGRKLSTPPRREAAFLLYERIHTRLVRFYEVLKRAHHVKEGWGTLLSKYGYEFYQDGLDAWERLNRLPLKEFCQAERMNRHLTHRDLASHNWLVTPDGGVWLIDFETVEYDTQLGDVWQMASRVLTQNDWADDWYDLILQTYESVCPLSSLEKKIVYTLFLFPNEFYREAIGVAERKQSFHPKHSMDYLYKIVENRNKWKKQLKQITYW